MNRLAILRPAVRAVVIDDSLLMRELLQSALAETGDIDIVGTAANPHEAREVIRATNPDVVTLDVEMPGMSGLDLAAATRAHPVLKSVPMFVATSAVYCDGLDRTHVDGVISKPFSVMEVKSALESVIGALG